MCILHVIFNVKMHPYLTVARRPEFFLTAVLVTDPTHVTLGKVEHPEQKHEKTIVGDSYSEVEFYGRGGLFQVK